MKIRHLLAQSDNHTDNSNGECWLILHGFMLNYVWEGAVLCHILYIVALQNEIFKQPQSWQCINTVSNGNLVMQSIKYRIKFYKCTYVHVAM